VNGAGARYGAGAVVVGAVTVSVTVLVERTVEAGVLTVTVRVRAGAVEPGAVAVTVEVTVLRLRPPVAAAAVAGFAGCRSTVSMSAGRPPVARTPASTPTMKQTSAAAENAAIQLRRGHSVPTARSTSMFGLIPLERR
jgi:hypothetical protein